MKRKARDSSVRYSSPFLLIVGTLLACVGVIQAQTGVTPSAASGVTPTAKPTSDQPAAPSAGQATDLSQIGGAEVTKTGGIITGLSIKDCKSLTAADYRLIRQQESLKALSFAHGPDDASLQLLAGMPAVESFSTNGTAITDAGVAILATFKILHGLTFFHPGRGFKGTGLAALADLPNLENLTVAGSLEFADPGMAAVGQLKHLKAFRTWHSGVTSEGIKSLGALKELTSLNIGQRLSNQPPAMMGDDAIAVISTFSSMESLIVGEARLSLSALSKLGQIPKLKNLSLAEIDIAESDVAVLKQRLPKTQITWTAPSPGGQKRIDGIFGTAATAAALPGTPSPVPAKK